MSQEEDTKKRLSDRRRAICEELDRIANAEREAAEKAAKKGQSVDVTESQARRQRLLDELDVIQGQQEE